MGLSVADLNCDGTLDIFGSNFGDYDFPTIGVPEALGDSATRWFLQNPDGSFSDPGVGATVSSVFAWGNGAVDIDNDGDPDLLSNGGLDMNLLAVADNPGTVLVNQGCSANFSLDLAALRQDYTRRNVQGMAVGDLNRDGFADIVTASNLTIQNFVPLLPGPAQWGAAYDPFNLFAPIFAPASGGGLVWTGIDFAPGEMTVEINNGGNGYGSVTIAPIGTVGITEGGVVPRSGFGATVSVTPKKGQTQTMPVLGGSSFMSQNAPEVYMGLGAAKKGTVDVLWPGGVRNRLNNVKPGEHVVFPEIPCSFDDDSFNFGMYQACVEDALAEIVAAGIIDEGTAGRFEDSALDAFKGK